MNTTATLEAEIVGLQELLDDLEESCDDLEDILEQTLEISDKIKRLEREISNRRR